MQSTRLVLCDHDNDILELDHFDFQFLEPFSLNEIIKSQIQSEPREMESQMKTVQAVEKKTREM